MVELPPPQLNFCNFNPFCMTIGTIVEKNVIIQKISKTFKILKFCRRQHFLSGSVLFSRKIHLFANITEKLFVGRFYLIYMERSIQEWAKWNLWKIAFKKFEVIWSDWADHIASNFLKTAFHKFHLVHSWILCPL